MILPQKLSNAMHCKWVGERESCVFVQNRKSCTQANISEREADLIFSSWLLASFMKYASNHITNHPKCLATLVCGVKLNILVRASKAHHYVLSTLLRPDLWASSVLFESDHMLCPEHPKHCGSLGCFLFVLLPCHRDLLYPTKPYSMFTHWNHSYSRQRVYVCMGGGAHIPWVVTEYFNFLFTFLCPIFLPSSTMHRELIQGCVIYVSLYFQNLT